MRHHSRLVVLCAVAAAFVLLGANCKLTNKAPSVPTIAGPATGVAGVPATYTATTTDPDGDSICVMFDWGDGATPAWTSLVASGDTVTATNTYSDSGVFTIRAKAKDKSGKESGWSAGQSLSLIPAAPAYPDTVVGEISIPWAASGASMSRDGRLICAGPSYAPDSVVIIRTLDRAITQRIRTGTLIHVAAFTRDDRYLFVSSDSSHATQRVDLGQGLVTHTLVTSRAPYALVLSPDDSRLYASISNERKVLVLRTDGLSRVDSILLGSKVRGLALNQAGTSLYVCTDSGVYVVDVGSLAVTASNSTIALASTVILSGDEQTAYVTSVADSGIDVLRANDLSVISKVNFHTNAFGEIAISPDDAHLYLTMPVGIYTLDTRTLATVDSVALDEMWGTIMPHPNGDSLYYAGGRKVWVIGKRQ